MSAQDEPDRKNLKSACVVQRGKNYYYPKTIPKERSSLAKIICLSISLLLFIVDIFTNEIKTTSIIALYVLAILLSFILQIFYRVILVVEETNHITSRYEGKITNLIKDAFHFQTKVCVTLVFSIIYAVYYCCTNDITELQFNVRNILLLLLPSVYLLDVLLEMETSPLNDSLWIAKDNGLNYGSGMAYSFFHGYLKLVLPQTGNQEKNLKELMQDYEAINRIRFAAYKLFILIPKSMNCFVSLKNDHSPSVDESISLNEKQLTVAGVQNRSYKNAVYKISTGRDRQKIYVSAEYATPLRTFLKVVEHAGTHTAIYDKHKNDIILQFYLTLKRVLEKTELDEFCELIYYEDYPQNSTSGNIAYYDVGEIILRRLKELKKNQNQKNKSD